jgi:hypothetical protein
LLLQWPMSVAMHASFLNDKGTIESIALVK